MTPGWSLLYKIQEIPNKHTSCLWDFWEPLYNFSSSVTHGWFGQLYKRIIRTGCFVGSGTMFASVNVDYGKKIFSKKIDAKVSLK